MLRLWLRERRRREQDSQAIKQQQEALGAIAAAEMSGDEEIVRIAGSEVFNEIVRAWEGGDRWWALLARPRLRMQQVTRFLSGAEVGGTRDEPTRRFLEWWRGLMTAAEGRERLARQGHIHYTVAWTDGGHGSPYSASWPHGEAATAKRHRAICGRQRR